jgi:tetratricopeptide (TPR) repeat protein
MNPLRLLPLLLCLAPPLHGQEKEIPPPRPTCAILPFDASGGLAEDEARFITDRYTALLPQYDKYDVVARGKINDLLKVAEFNRAEYTSSTEYAIEIGKVLQVRYVIHGTIGHIGDLYSLNTTVVDVETAKIVHTAITDYKKSSLTDFAERGPEENIRVLLGLSAPPPRGNPGVVDPGTTNAVAGASAPTTPPKIEAPAPDRSGELVRARRFYEANMNDQAIAILEKAVSGSGDTADAHLLLGKAYARKKGWYQIAVQEFEKAVEHDPGSVEARIELARVHVENGKNARATKLLREALALDPENKPAAELLREAEPPR